jgi:hypothetical protein
MNRIITIKILDKLHFSTLMEFTKIDILEMYLEDFLIGVDK